MITRISNEPRQTPAASQSTSLLARLFAWQRAKVKQMADACTALRHYNELLDMPDHMLKDMGLTRDMVRYERSRLLRTGDPRRPDGRN